SAPMHRPGLGSQISHYAPPMRNEHSVQEEMGVPGNLVKVQFSQDGGPNDRERFVNIVGQPAGIADARRQIQEIITSSQTGERPGGYGGYGGGGNYGMGGGDSYGRGGNSSTIQIPSTKVGLVIGRRGETIRDLQDRSGARIAVTPTPEDQHSASRTVTITGDDNAIERAKALIEEIVNDMAPRGAYGGAGGGGFQNTPPVTMTVPQESIGLVIGRGGETVKQLQIQSRAKIQVQQVDPSVPAPAERTINLFGPPEAVEYAKQLIMEKVNGARDNDRYGGRDQGGYGGSSSGGYGGYGGYNQQQSYQQPASSAGGYGQQYGSGYAAAAPAATPAAATTYTPEQQAAYAQYYGYNYGGAAGGYGAAASAAPGADATAASSATATPAVGTDASSYGTYDYSRYGQYGTTGAASSSAPATSVVAAVTPAAAGATPAAGATTGDASSAASAAPAASGATAAGSAAAPDYSAYYAQQEAYQQYYSQYYGGYQAPDASGAAAGTSDASASESADKGDAPATGSSDAAADSTKE
ncbi:hypothetical protein BGZ95_010041, partial [Linnemannia exigua]